MITYSLDASAVIDTHKKTGVKYEEKLIFPAIHGAVKNVLGKWDAVTVIDKREEATDLIEKTLDNKLKSFGIKITLVEIADISFKEKFEEAVEAKQIAEQEANRAKNLTVKIEEEAKQKVIAAKAEAEAMRIKTEALEKNKSLVEYEAVLRWDGKLPTYMMGGAVPFMNITPEKK